MATPPRRKVFFSYFQGDAPAVQSFIREREHLFIPRVLGVRDDDTDLINSTNAAYVMSQIRARYIQDSTVTILMVGDCTHSRRYVDWEIKASLTQGTESLPNGLIGIILNPTAANARLHERFEANWSSGHVNCYARYWQFPKADEHLRGWIEDAHDARTTRAHLISNPQETWKNSRRCEIHGETH